MIVPMPTSPKICPRVKPARTHSATPATTQIRSVMIRQMGKGIRVCFSYQISATAS